MKRGYFISEVIEGLLLINPLETEEGNFKKKLYKLKLK